MEQMQRDRDLVLPPNTFAFVLDSTKGRVSVYVGPFKSSLSNTDQLVVWDERNQRFTPEFDPDFAIKTFTKANEGEYVILSDPAKGDSFSHPPIGTTSDTTELAAGRKTILPGPLSFPLWPGQTAHTVPGHHLRSNHYLLVRVYEPEEAQRNAESAVVATTGEERTDDAIRLSERFTMGQLIVIKGTEVSFYIPPTGIEVVPEANGNYVRDAATLERLEYCILLDEDGEKRYVQGPAVVFPEPTEEFVTDDDGNDRFRDIELNETTGLHIKVIADHVDDNGTEHKAGQELFITGEVTPIYRPRPEQSIISIGGRARHYAMAVPKGDGRYILDRRTGEVTLVRGPEMFLPDPRYQTVVRRILDPRAVAVMYPNNQEAVIVNQAFEEQRQTQAKRARKAGVPAAPEQFLATSYASMTPVEDSVEAPSATPASLRQSASTQFVGERVERTGGQRPPQNTITLDDKYEGAVRVKPWSGYAVLVTNKTGDRRVVQGPEATLLEYDEELEQLSLSTGKPKTDHNPYKTVYLRTINNQVSDQVIVETADLVPVTLDLSYRVNFEGDEPAKWFDVENYVQLLTDNCRSRLRNVAKRHDIKGFYTHYIDIIRDALLGEVIEGEGRPGRTFSENQMRLYDVEVLNARINDQSVGQLLSQAMHSAMSGAIHLAQAEEEAERTKAMEALRRSTLAELETTREAEATAALADLRRTLEKDLHGAENDLLVASEEVKQAQLSRDNARAEFEQNMELQSRLDLVELSRLTAEAEQFIKRMEATKGGVIEALQTFGDKHFIEQLTESLGPVALAAGVSTVDIFAQVFKGTPFEPLMDALSERPYSNGHNRIEATSTH